MSDAGGPAREEHSPPRVAELAGAFAEALLAGDEVAAEVAISEAIEAGLTVAIIDEKVIAPALWLIGELWERGSITVAEEHIATEIVVRVLALQREAHRVIRSRRRHRVMLATPTGERHVVALRMVGNLLREAGYGVVMLGPDVPGPDLALAARRHGAEVICLSATTSGGARELLAAIDEVHLVSPAAGFVVGGRAVTPESEARAGVRLCARVSDAVEAVDALIQRAALN